MKNWIGRQVGGTKIITPWAWFLLKGNTSSRTSASTQISSAVEFARALYSASVLDLDTVGYFMALQETRLGPKNIANPPVVSIV
jgi:hypothetical protein